MYEIRYQYNNGHLNSHITQMPHLTVLNLGSGSGGTVTEAFEDKFIESGLNSLHPSTVKRKLSKNKRSSINTGPAKPLPSREKMQCPKCPLMVAKFHIMKHERLHHDENLPYGCDICSYRSLLPFSIKSHIGIHHKEKKFACRLGCGQAFTTSGYRQVLLNILL